MGRDAAERPPSVAPFGRWPSPLDPATAGAGRRSRSALAADTEAVFWLEGRPEEAGRSVIVRCTVEGEPQDVTGPGVSVRSRVHEYGGGAYCLIGTGARAGAVAYVDQGDQRVWVQGCEPGSAAVPLSPEPPPGVRWHHGDLRAGAAGSFVLSVREAHQADGSIRRGVIALGLDPFGAQATLVEGTAFVAAPRPGPDGRIAWVTWEHPEMPWDASELWVGRLSGEGGHLQVEGAGKVAGGRGEGANGDDVSVGQPLWLSDGGLAFVSDAGGWWQPWRWDPTGSLHRLCADEAEFHGPDWLLGQATMAEVDGRLVCRRRHRGLDEVGLVDPATSTFEALDQPCVSVGAVVAHRGGAVWLGATPERGSGPWWWSPSTPARSLSVGDRDLVPAGDVSAAEAFSVSARGPRVPGLYFAPVLGSTRGPRGAAPPLIVFCHGGPTGSAEGGFDPVVQLFTSHGFAVAAVDYAGSTGYGRAYRRRLLGAWGVADADDCAEAAMGLAALGLADPERMAIRGGSAGGFTALCALARTSVFCAAVSWYGVTDLLSLAATTHDFEAHYTDSLVGPLPDAADLYRRRSPVNLVEDMDGAVLILQGLDDPVVPPGQATAMVEALSRRGRTVEYLAFEGEGHGFRRADTLAAALAAELAFYQELLAPLG